MSRQRLFLFLGIACLVLVVAACSGKKRITSAEVESALPPTSAENVLQNIAFAYQTLDFELYRDQFKPNLKLRFTDEIQKYMDENPQTDYEWDMESTGNLFGNAEWIQFEVLFDPPQTSTVEGFSGDDGFVEIKAHSVMLEVKRKDSEDTWLATNEEAILVMEKDASVSPPTFQVVYMHYLGAPEATAGE